MGVMVDMAAMVVTGEVVVAAGMEAMVETAVMEIK
jgi:hypothetical protein